MARPVFYYDLSSAYSWLAAERIRELIPDADWRPVFLAGMFKLNGRSSWLFGDEREARMREIEERAERYGLARVRWPAGLPSSVLDLARAATVSKREGREVEFALAAFRAAFTEGRDVSEPRRLEALANASGLDARELLEAIGRQEIKDRLREATEEAHAAGAPGVPAVVVGGEAYWGDDRLDEAAAAARRAA